MSVEFPLRAYGVVSITKDKLSKMAVAVKIHVQEIKSRHPLPGRGDPTIGLDDNLMFEKNRENYLRRAGRLPSAATGRSVANVNPFRLIWIPDENPNVRSSVRTLTSVVKGIRRNALFSKVCMDI